MKTLNAIFAERYSMLRGLIGFLPISASALVFLFYAAAAQSQATADLTISPTDLTVGEGTSGTFTVKLATDPSAEVRVTLEQPSASDNDDVSFTPDELTFTEGDDGNWDTTQTVTVTAAADDDGIGDKATINLTAAGGDYASVRGSVMVTVKDDDHGLYVSASSLDVRENGENSFTVRLNRVPTGNVTVDLDESPSNSDINITPASLSFTPSNWNIEQVVIVSADDDTDTVDDEATIDLSVSGDDQYDASVSIDVKDDDKTAAFVISVTSLAVIEEGSDTFTVRLATEPSASVTVTLAQPSNTEVTVDTDTDENNDQNTLIFTTSNWDDPQTVTVTAAEDSDSTDDTATIGLTATGGGYASVTGSVAIAVADTDAAGLVAPTSLSIDEDGNGTFDVRLTTAPTANVTVTLAQSGTSNDDVSFDTNPVTSGDQSTLTFTSDNWSTAQSVTVSADEDNDLVEDTATISLAAEEAGSENGYDDVTGSVAITVNDNDTAGLTISKKHLSLIEGSDSDSEDTFTVRLTNEPSASVTVSVPQPSNTDVTVDDTSLTFTTSDWNDPQTITVTAASDAGRLPDTATINLTAANGGYASAAGSVSVSVADDDLTLITSPSSSAREVDEGETANLTVRLSHRPTENIYVSAAVGSNSSSDVRINDNEILVFTPSSWNTNQTVEISARDDPDAIDERGSIDISASGFGYVIQDRTVNVDITDDEDADLILSPTSLSINEGEPGTFTIALAGSTAPSAPLTIVVIPSSAALISVDADTNRAGTQNNLTFTPSNWQTPQTIEVSALSDEDEDNNSATISFSFDGANYEGTSETQMTVTITDSDTPNLILSTRSLAIDEGENNSELSIRLTSPPTGGNVTVTLDQASNDTNSDVTIDTNPDESGNQETLIFTTDNWRTPQSVTVAAAEDDDAANETAMIRVMASGGGYNIVSGDNVRVSVTVSDDETPGLTVSTSYLAINEEESGTFTVQLATEPSETVTVTLAQPSNTDVTVDTNTSTANNQNTIEFTTANWDDPQTVTVTAAEDADDDEDTATIVISAAGGEYANAERVNVSVTAGDNDDEMVLTSTKNLAVTEGAQATFTLRLTKEPGANDTVTVTLVQPSNDDVTVDTDTGTAGNQRELTFDADNWDEPQSVTVSAADDSDDQDETASIDITAEGGDYGDAGGRVAVAVTDDDKKGFTLSLSEISINEGQGTTLSVSLSSIPSGNVTVTLAQPLNTDITLDTDSDADGNQSTLTFSTDNWNTAQVVNISTIEDDDAIADTAIIVISATGGGYNDVERVEIPVSVSDGDTAEMTVSPSSLTIDEGQGDILTVSLSAPPAPPSEDVTITLTRSGSTDVIFTPATLTFTAANWNTAQTVGINAAHDEDEANDSATITVAASGGGYDDTSTTVNVTVPDDDAPGIAVNPKSLSIVEGQSGFFIVRLSKAPSADVTLTLAQPSNTNVTLDTDPGTAGNQNTLLFTSASWNTPRGVAVSVAEDDNTETETTNITISASGATEYASVSTRVPVEAAEGSNPGNPLTWDIQSTAPAIPPPSAQDASTVRVRCIENREECSVFFDCSAQDGSVYRGPTPPLTLSSWHTEALSIRDMMGHVGGDWSGRGRLTCSVRSQQDVSTQVWTRSGDGVLVNNSAILRSTERRNTQGNRSYHVDIESIPSPNDTANRSNIRIRCESDNDCTNVTFDCYEDDGRRHPGVLGTVQSKHTRHLQAPELADDIVEHRWNGMGFTCEVGSDAPFSVQILTRTGGGGALVNNSASSGTAQ